MLERLARERTVRRSRRTRRVFAGAGAFSGAAAAVIAAVLLIGGGGSSPGTQVAMSGTAGRATATLRSASAGTEVDVKVTGLHPGHYYWLWLTGDDGHRIPAGTFSGTGSKDELQLMAAIPLSETRRIWVTDDQRRVVLDAFVKGTH